MTTEFESETPKRTFFSRNVLLHHTLYGMVVPNLSHFLEFSLNVRFF